MSRARPPIPSIGEPGRAIRSAILLCLQADLRVDRDVGAPTEGKMRIVTSTKTKDEPVRHRQLVDAQPLRAA
jgi:hypothetical protein